MPFLDIAVGNASEWTGPYVHLVFTHPYAPLPLSLIGKPMLINLFGDKRALAESWVGSQLQPISTWGKGQRNCVYVANMAPKACVLTDLREDNTGLEPGKGWFPIALPLRLLRAYGPYLGLQPGAVIWDGFMGRGTVGKACQMLGYSYIGRDKDPERVEIARRYLALDRPA